MVFRIYCIGRGVIRYPWSCKQLVMEGSLSSAGDVSSGSNSWFGVFYTREPTVVDFQKPKRRGLHDIGEIPCQWKRR